MVISIYPEVLSHELASVISQDTDINSADFLLELM